MTALNPKKLLEKIMDISPDLIVCAGWMHILGSEFLNGLENIPIINLHPALPGMFPGADGIGDALKAYQEGKISQTGVMVHEVIAEIDAGKVLGTVIVPIEKTDNLETLSHKVKSAEKPLLLSVIKQIIIKQMIIK